MEVVFDIAGEGRDHLSLLKLAEAYGTLLLRVEKLRVEGSSLESLKTFQSRPDTPTIRDADRLL